MYQLACEAGQKLDSIQNPKRRNGEGGDKNFSTPEGEEARMQEGGLAKQGPVPQIWIGSTWR